MQFGSHTMDFAETESELTAQNVGGEARDTQPNFKCNRKKKKNV